MATNYDAWAQTYGPAQIEIHAVAVDDGIDAPSTLCGTVVRHDKDPPTVLASSLLTRRFAMLADEAEAPNVAFATTLSTVRCAICAEWLGLPHGGR